MPGALDFKFNLLRLPISILLQIHEFRLADLVRQPHRILALFLERLLQPWRRACKLSLTPVLLGGYFERMDQHADFEFRQAFHLGKA